MTSGGLTMTEGWNLQLQGKVRRLEAEVERLRVAFKLNVGRWPEPALEPPQVTEAEIDALLAEPEQEGVDAALGEPKASEHLSSERRRGLEEVLRAYEQWEADVILRDEAWDTETGVYIPDDLWDRFIEIQGMRNAVLIPPSSEGGAPAEDSGPV